LLKVNACLNVLGGWGNRSRDSSGTGAGSRSRHCVRLRRGGVRGVRNRGRAFRGAPGNWLL